MKLFAKSPAAITIILPRFLHMSLLFLYILSQGPLLVKSFGVNRDYVSYMFAIQPLASLVTVFTGSILVKIGYGGIVYLFGAIFGALALLIFLLVYSHDLFHSLTWWVTGAVFVGMSHGNLQAPLYIVFEKVAINLDLHDQGQIRALTQAWQNVFYTSGSMFGSLFVGGLILDYLGFAFAYIFLLCLYAGAITASGLSLQRLGLLGLQYFVNDER